MIDLKELNKEQLAALEAQLEAKKKAENEKRIQDLAALETLENDVLTELFPEAQQLSNAIVTFKRKCLDKLEPLVRMKIDYGKAAPEQESYSFKKTDNSVKSVIRYNRTTRYDDGVQAAVSYSKEWLQNQVENEKTKQLVSIIDDFLSRDEKGNYSPSKLLLFVKKAEEIGAELLLKAADAIKQSIYEDMTSISVLFSHKDDMGVERKLPLSATKA